MLNNIMEIVNRQHFDSSRTLCLFVPVDSRNTRVEFTIQRWLVTLIRFSLSLFCCQFLPTPNSENSSHVPSESHSPSSAKVPESWKTFLSFPTSHSNGQNIISHKEQSFSYSLCIRKLFLLERGWMSSLCFILPLLKTFSINYHVIGYTVFLIFIPIPK